MNTLIRDTIIEAEVYNALPTDRQQRIKELVSEFKKLGYVDARLILPDQVARQSERQRKKQSETRLRVFAIENEIKQLLKSDEQLSIEAKLQAEQALQAQIQRLQNSIKNLELYCCRQLNSKRENVTKQEYKRLQAQLKEIM